MQHGPKKQSGQHKDKQKEHVLDQRMMRQLQLAERGGNPLGVV
jgi:hypothetical protein